MNDANRRQPLADADRYRYFPATKRYRHIGSGERARSLVRRTCDGCGAEFVASRGQARWCSDRCRKRAGRAAVR